MKHRFAVLVVLAAGAFAGATAAPAAPSLPASRAGISKTCSAGYVHASLSWGHKCLRAGQFCKVGNSEYLKYGFNCPPSGHLRRR